MPTLKLEFSILLVNRTRHSRTLRETHRRRHWTDHFCFGDLALFRYAGILIDTVSGHKYGHAFLSAVERYGLDVKEFRRVQKAFALIDAGRLDLALAVDLTSQKLIQ